MDRRNINHGSRFRFTWKKEDAHFKGTSCVVDKKTKQIICTVFTNGKHYDFRLFKEFKTMIKYDIKVVTDIGYQCIKKLHKKSELPKKKSKKIL